MNRVLETHGIIRDLYGTEHKVRTFPPRNIPGGIAVYVSSLPHACGHMRTFQGVVGDDYSFKGSLLKKLTHYKESNCKACDTKIATEYMMDDPWLIVKLIEHVSFVIPKQPERNERLSYIRSNTSFSQHRLAQLLKIAFAVKPEAAVQYLDHIGDPQIAKIATKSIKSPSKYIVNKYLSK